MKKIYAIFANERPAIVHPSAVVVDQSVKLVDRGTEFGLFNGGKVIRFFEHREDAVKFLKNDKKLRFSKKDITTDNHLYRGRQYIGRELTTRAKPSMFNHHLDLVNAWFDGDLSKFPFDQVPLFNRYFYVIEEMEVL